MNTGATIAAAVISVPGGAGWELPPDVASQLARPNTKRGRLQRAALALLLDWNDAGITPSGPKPIHHPRGRNSIAFGTLLKGAGR